MGIFMFPTQFAILTPVSISNAPSSKRISDKGYYTLQPDGKALLQKTTYVLCLTYDIEHEKEVKLMPN